MSANNQLVVVKKNDRYYVYHNLCMDNEFIEDAKHLLGDFTSAEIALEFCNEYMRESYVEYGVRFINKDNQKEDITKLITQLDHDIEDAFTMISALDDRIKALKEQMKGE